MGLNYKFLVLTIVGLLLSGCGGSGTTDTVVLDIERPGFLKTSASRTVGFSPVGNITETSPTFTWIGTTNATDYEIGYEDPNNSSTWTTHAVSATVSNCNTSGNSSCSFKPIVTFAIGDYRAWWVRAKVNGVWQDWSSVHTFTVVKDNTTVEIPETLTPVGTIHETSPTFTWKGVSNATEYRLGYEELSTQDSWEELTLLSSVLNCQNTTQNCTFTPPADTFKKGNNIAWYVRVKVGGNLGEWSNATLFTIADDTVIVDIPNTIAPVGLISQINPSFIWKGVPNATEYIFGYEKQTIGSSWEEITLTSSAVNCQNLAQDCTFTPATGTFKDGDSVAWYVRAKKANKFSDWSSGKYFTINVAPPTVTNIIINEVLAANTHTNVDLDYIEFSDWIELYNPTNQDQDISNYGLSDNNDPQQWIIPNGTTIKANDYLLIWADSKNTNNKELHASFKLSAKGEKLTLADSSGLVIDSIDFKKQNSDISSSNLNGEIVFMSPTPGEQNSVTHASKDRSELPDYSHTSGFYDNPISVVLTQTNNADIFYTIDGSIPNQTSAKYTQSIDIVNTSVIRAVALDAGGLLSEIKSQTYFINHVSTLPVLSFVTDPDHLFDPKTGIYVDGDGTNGVPFYQCYSSPTAPKNYAQEWERPVDLEYFGVNHVSQFVLRAGLSIAGECSRGYQKKSFSIDMDKKFGFKSLNYKLYPSKDVTKVKDFKLRTGALGFQVSDILAAAIVTSGDLQVDYQAYKTIQVFVNAEYWGLYNYREKKGKDYITSNYPNIDKDDLDIIQNGYKVKAGDINDYNALVDYIVSKNIDFSDDADYQEVLTMIDEDNYIDYMSLMIYSSNIDWIDSNLRSWKEKNPGNKWRWMLDDLDAGFNSINVNQNWFTEVNNSSSSDAMIVLFQSLTKNVIFKQKFKARFTTLLDTTFSTANMLSLINTIIDERKDYFPLEPLIWDSIHLSWLDEHVQSLKDFANQRNVIVRTQLEAFIP